MSKPLSMAGTVDLVSAFWSAHPRTRFKPSVIAAVLSTSESRLDKLRIAGAGPSFLKEGRIVLYEKRAVVDYIERNSTTQVRAAA